VRIIHAILCGLLGAAGLPDATLASRSRPESVLILITSQASPYVAAAQAALEDKHG